MQKSRIALAVYALIGLIIVSLTTFFLVNYIKRWALIHQQRCVISETEEEINEYQKLGFADNASLIQLLHSRIQRAQTRIDSLEHTWLVIQTQLPTHKLTSSHIALMTSINKKMLISYINDIKEYKKMNIPTNHPIITFAQDKIIRLTLALAELERQRNNQIFNTNNEYIKRASRMYEINKQSITQFKKELHNHQLTGLPDTDQKVLFVRKQITQKTHDMHTIEKLLQDH